MLDCSGAGLDIVPDPIPDDAVVLDFNHNLIKQLHDDSFANCTSVVKLDLSFNEIKVLRNSMLRGFWNLEEIDIDYNKLYYNETSFPDSPFENLAKLKSLSIISFFHQVPTGVYPSMDGFRSFLQKIPNNLEVLNILIPEDGEFSSALTNFTNLRKLEIVTGEFNIIENTTFTCLKHLPLEELISEAYISSVEPLAFHFLPELKSLEMSELNWIESLLLICSCQTTAVQVTINEKKII